MTNLEQSKFCYGLSGHLQESKDNGKVMGLLSNPIKGGCRRLGNDCLQELMIKDFK